MPGNAWQMCEGSIPGLRLPRQTWNVLTGAQITRLTQLKAVADRIEHVIPGIGSKSARVIRSELARIAALEEQENAERSSD
jgi:hypothetical protein